MSPPNYPLSNMTTTAKSVFFVGIKGVGMTALAVAMKDAGYEVQGSDTKEEFITDEVLKSHGITVHPLDFVIPSVCDLVIHSAAYQAPQSAVPLAQALADFVRDRKVIAVAGVGGKTTTSAMVAALFHAAGRDVGYYVGTSTIAGLSGPGHQGTDPYFVLEADEYAVSKTDHRAKFELIQPDILITTNIVHDHPDIYPDEAATLAVFGRLVARIRPGGVWIYNPRDPLTVRLRETVQKITMIPYVDDGTTRLSVFGDQNRSDAAAAVLAAHEAGIPLEIAKKHITAYRGAGRRQEYHGDVAGRHLYDDYGHHPGEIAVTVRSFQTKYPLGRVLLVFEAHTYSRTESLLHDFATAIATADIPFIMPIFESAREKGASHTITPESFAAEVARLNPTCTAVTWDNAASQVVSASRPGDVILTMGAGVVYKLQAEFKRLLQ